MLLLTNISQDINPKRLDILHRILPQKRRTCPLGGTYMYVSFPVEKKDEPCPALSMAEWGQHTKHFFGFQRVCCPMVTNMHALLLDRTALWGRGGGSVCFGQALPERGTREGARIAVWGRWFASVSCITAMCACKLLLTKPNSGPLLSGWPP